VTWTPHFIDENLDGAMCLDTADIDRDNDPDIIATGSNANVVVWYENPTWSKDTIDANLLGAWGVRAADMDGDDNPDVVAAGTNANSVVWYKNNDAGQTWEKDTIDANLLGPFCLYIGDIDLDKSLDVVVTDRYGNKVVWYPNNLPAPWVRDTIDYNLAWANDVVLADIDDDTDLDAVVTAWNANQVVWYENQFIVGIKRLQEIVPAGWSLSQNYPNPFNPSTVISWQLSVSSSVTLTIFTITGKKVVTLVDKRQPAGFYSIEWDASNLASGVYLYRLQTGDYVETRKMVLMR
jgi:hypothetical protein